MLKSFKHKSNAGASTESGPISDMSHHKASASKAFLENHYKKLLGGERPVGPREKELTVADFHLIKCIGRGAFGEVFVCQRKGETPGQLYALKRLRKTDMIRKKQITHVRSEKDVLSEAAATNEWVVRLYWSFQDETHLYMVMEYMPGGDMISWLCEKGIFDVPSSRFYIAELCAAVQSVHAMRFVHRDIKPDNILLDLDGHIKLSDFGLSKRFSYPGAEDVGKAGDGSSGESGESEVLNNAMAANPKSGTASESPHSPYEEAPSPSLPEGNRHVRDRPMFESIVGSPGYIAPEILMRQPYSINCDWWSVGVIMYEMIYGIPPFYSKDPNSTCHKITHWKEYLRFPSGRGIPDDAVDFMKRLMCDPSERMTFTEIENHPFFAGLDLTKLRQMKAAYKPELSNPLDTKYFPEIDESAMRRTADDRSILDVDPRGVMFADFQYKFESKGRPPAKE